MQESDTYLAIRDEGQEKGIRRALLLIGEERFGPPDESVKALINNIRDLDCLERMVRRAAKAANWQEILHPPAYMGMHDSDTYLAILDEGQEKASRESILVVGEERFGPPEEAVRIQLANITDLERLERMHRRAVKAASWQEILDTP